MAKYKTLNLAMCNGKIINQLSTTEIHMLKNNAVNYIYYNLAEKKIYIGETNSFMNRHSQHLGEIYSTYDFKKFSGCVVIYSKIFNKSSILDIESLLLNYMIAESNDTKFTFVNGNIGQTKLVYENKEEILTEVFCPLWKDELSEFGLVKNNDIEELKESLLYKYSPFKQLSPKQREISRQIEKQFNEKYLIEAPAGSGKSVLFTTLAFALAEKYPNLKIGVITTGNLINQFNLIFKSVGLSNRLVVKTGSQLITEAKEENKFYDIVIVDEAHKLKKYYTKGHPNSRRHLSLGQNEIQLLESISKGLVLLYDSYQGIKPQNISPSEMKKMTNNYIKLFMKQQFRIGGGSDISGEDFLNGILYALQLSDETSFDRNVFRSDYFNIVDNFSDVIEYVEEHSHVYPELQSRLVAGYCREWASNAGKKSNKGTPFDELPYDWDEDGIQKRWNSTYVDWVKKRNSENEIGSIHAIQGYDLNYVGVIIGRDITVENGQFVAVPSNYKDVGGTPLKKEFNLNELSSYILNIYYVLLSRGIDGCTVFFEDKKVEKLFKARIKY